MARVWLIEEKVDGRWAPIDDELESSRSVVFFSASAAREYAAGLNTALPLTVRAVPYAPTKAKRAK